MPSAKMSRCKLREESKTKAARDSTPRPSSWTTVSDYVPIHRMVRRGSSAAALTSIRTSIQDPWALGPGGRLASKFQCPLPPNMDDGIGPSTLGYTVDDAPVWYSSTTSFIVAHHVHCHLPLSRPLHASLNPVVTSSRRSQLQ